MRYERIIHHLMIHQAQCEASRKTVSGMVDGFVWAVLIVGFGFAIVGGFSITVLLAAGIGGAIIEGAKS